MDLQLSSSEMIDATIEIIRSFSYVEKETLASCRLVSKQWREIVELHGNRRTFSRRSELSSFIQGIDKDSVRSILLSVTEKGFSLTLNNKTSICFQSPADNRRINDYINSLNLNVSMFEYQRQMDLCPKPYDYLDFLSSSSPQFLADLVIQHFRQSASLTHIFLIYDFEEDFDFFSAFSHFSLDHTLYLFIDIPEQGATFLPRKRIPLHNTFIYFELEDLSSLTEEEIPVEDSMRELESEGVEDFEEIFGFIPYLSMLIDVL